MFRIPIVKGRLGIEDNIRSGLIVLEGNIIQLGNLFLYLGEGSVEFVLFAECVLADEVEMGCIALEGEGGLCKDEEEDGQC